MHTLGILVIASNPGTWEMGRQEGHKLKVVLLINIELEVNLEYKRLRLKKKNV